MTHAVCQSHFSEFLADEDQRQFIEMIVPLENCSEECEFKDCNEKVTRKIYGKGESATIGLPSRKDYIIQMVKEVRTAMEIGCIVEFSGEDKFMSGMPQLTLYKFLVNKEMLIANINSMEKNK